MNMVYILPIPNRVSMLTTDPYEPLVCKNLFGGQHYSISFTLLVLVSDMALLYIVDDQTSSYYKFYNNGRDYTVGAYTIYIHIYIYIYIYMNYPEHI